MPETFTAIGSAYGTLVSLASFTFSLGESPDSVAIDSAGNLFGTTVQGGSSGVGTIWELEAGSGTIADLASFNGNNGKFADSYPVIDSQGNLFGTTESGGTADGTVRELKGVANVSGVGAASAPAPEPAALAMLLPGLTIAAALARRRMLRKAQDPPHDGSLSRSPAPVLIWRKPVNSSFMICARSLARLAALIVCAAPAVQASAQSLSAQKPAQLQQGSNSGTVDNFVGPNYFYFWAEPGKTTITMTYKSMSLLGNAMKSDLVIELTDDRKTWVKRATITSLKESSQQQLIGTLKKETKLLLTVLPPSGGLVRTGGDYEITATGAVRFDKPLGDTGLIVGTYTPSVVYNNEDTACKFLPNGTLQFASGTAGTWKLFDGDSHLYTVSFGSNRLSLKLIPGRGLVAAADPTQLIFQRNR